MDNNKTIIEDENEMMQKYMKEMKDKMGEQSKNFDDAIKKVENNA